MSLPGFTAEVSIYQSTRRYMMAFSLAPTKGGGLASIAATINPFMPSGGGNGTQMCYPKGCGPCYKPGYCDFQNQDYPDCTHSQRPCDYYEEVYTFGPCKMLHCKGGICDFVPC